MPYELIPHKTIGAHTVYERRPKPVGATKYLVEDASALWVADFGRYSTAVRWCRAQLPKPSITAMTEALQLLSTNTDPAVSAIAREALKPL